MKKFIAFLMIYCFILSCNKNENCVKNCVDVIINAKILNTGTNKGVPDIPIYVNLKTPGSILGGASSTPLANGKTNISGDCTFNLNVDSTTFLDNSMTVEIIAKDVNFTYDPVPIDPLGKSIARYTFKAAGVHDFVFKFHPK